MSLLLLWEFPGQIFSKTMTMWKCKMCGGNVVPADGGSCGTCDACGGTTTLPRVSDERRANLFNRANHLRRLREFDKAVSAYEAILGEDNTEAEAHWGVVLSRYGIEYVEDPASGERIPTCHRTQVESVLLDADYLMALEHAPDAGAREYYQGQGKRIAEIQRDILAVSAQEASYDVFVCYKESTEGGSRTPDSVLAQEIHQHFTEKGMRVFYARTSLEEHAGQKYEPYIYGALTSARVMVVVGTRVEHFNAVWVRNEWSRFLQLRRKDQSKVLIPCYKGMDAYELPQELAELQSQDMGRLGFMQDMVRGVEKVLGRDRAKPAEKASASTASNETTGWLKRAWIFLEDEDFASASEYAERVLDRHPETGEAYWIKVLAGFRLRRERDLETIYQSLAGNGNYSNALKFGTMELRQRLERFEADIQKRMAETQKNRWELYLQRAQAEERDRLQIEAKRLELERQAAEAKARVEAEERKRHSNILLSVHEQVACGNLEVARNLFSGLERRFTDLAYDHAAQVLMQAEQVHAEFELLALNVMLRVFGLAYALHSASFFGRFAARNALREALPQLETINKRLMQAAFDKQGSESSKKLTEWTERIKKLEASARFFNWPLLSGQLDNLASELPCAAEAKLVFRLGISLPLSPGFQFNFSDIVARWVPAGRFTMGSPLSELGRNEDENQHDVDISRGFFLAETACTQSQWEAVMEGNPSLFIDPNNPVDSVSWDAAVEYCRRLTAKQQGEGILPEGWKWRLPTEAEWEYAARAGTKRARYGKLESIAWYEGNSSGHTHPVKQKAPNAWGLHDMLGNVEEWCEDYYEDYPTKNVTDPKGPSSGEERIIRGGYWLSDTSEARLAVRKSDDPSDPVYYPSIRPVLGSVR
jgi:hypothetical protein